MCRSRRLGFLAIEAGWVAKVGQQRWIIYGVMRTPQVGDLLIMFTVLLREEGQQGDEAIVNSCLLRLRPVSMTALVALLGLIPLALSA